MAFLFDLDGTLIDSEAAHKSAEVETLAAFGYDFSEEDLFEFTGVPYRAMLARIAPELGVEEFLAAHKGRLLALVGDRIVRFTDVDACLARFARGPMAIVTSSPRWYVEAVLEAFPILRAAFRSYVCADDVTTGKPDPEPYLLAASRIGVDPSASTAVEDSANGIASAKAAGCYTVAVRRDARIDLSRADAVIDSLGELSEVA